MALFPGISALHETQTSLGAPYGGRGCCTVFLQGETKAQRCHPAGKALGRSPAAWVGAPRLLCRGKPLAQLPWGTRTPG